MVNLKKNFILNSLLLFILGALSSLSLPPFNIFILNFFTFSIFFIFLFKQLNIRSKKRISFYYGWLFGFGYFFTNLYWITISLTFDPNFKYLIPFAQILIPAFLASFYGLISVLFYFINLKNVLSAFFLFSFLFGFVEFIRGNIFTGFPWNLIVYSFSDYLNFINIISVVGTYSMNLLAISLFSSPAILILKRSRLEIFVFTSLLIISTTFFVFGLINKQKFLSKEIKPNPYVIRALGTNIGLDRFNSNNQTEDIINELINISSPDNNKKIFFLWPEGIIPGVHDDELVLYKDLFSESFNEKHIIGLGITSRLFKENNNFYFNSLSIFDNNLNLMENYKKVNLVPFGEFIPFEKILNKLGLKVITSNLGSFTSGEKRKIFKIENNYSETIKFLPLICYEIIYSGNLTKNFNFDFIINISEDGWFGKSIGPKQHFVHSIFRAIESGKYVIRSSNNGMAAVINPIGEIEQKIDYG